MPYNTILTALETKLANFATANSYDVAWPDVRFTPTDAYLQPAFLPAETAFGTLADSSDYGGIFQVDVVTRKGGGTADSRAIVDDVLAEFAKGVKATNVLIEKSWASPMFDRDDAYIIVPISIQYRYFE